MASITDMLIQSGLQTTQQSADLAGAASRGANAGLELGKVILTAQQQRVELEKTKKDLQDARMSKFVEAIDKSKSFKDPAARKNYLTKFLPAYRDKLGLTDAFPDESLQFMTVSEENMDRIRTLTNQVANGEISAEAAVAIANDPIKLAEVAPTSSLFGGKEGEAPDLAEAIKFNRDKVTQKEVAEYNAQAALGKQVQGQDATGKVTVSKGIADDFVDFTKKGGDGAYEKTIEAYEKAIKKLKSNEVELGTRTKKIAGAVGLGNAALTFDDDAKALIQDIQDNINIRTKSGDPNPTSVQIQEIMARSIDPTLKNPANIQKLEAELKRVKKERAERKAGFRSQGYNLGPTEGDTKEWNGSTYKVIKGQWVKQK